MNKFDLFFFHGMECFRPDWFVAAVRAFSWFGYPAPMIFIVILVMIALFVRKKGAQGIFLGGAMVIEALMNHWIKGLVRRPRPMYFGGTEPGFSFPSGHAMAAMTFAILLVYLISMNIHGKHKRFYIGIVLLLSILMGLSRVYLGVHYMTDVLAGWLLALLWAGFCIYLFQKNIEPWMNRNFYPRK